MSSSMPLESNPLNIDYDRFTKADIHAPVARADINSCMRKFSGIRTIAMILKAAAIETNAQCVEPLASEILIGLADALTELALDGGIQIENVGIHLAQSDGNAKKGRA